MPSAKHANGEGHRIKDCRGTLTIGQKPLDVTFDFSCNGYGAVNIEVAHRALDPKRSLLCPKTVAHSSGALYTLFIG